MTPTTPRSPADTRQAPSRRPIGHAHLTELRARLTQQCNREDNNHNAVRTAVDTAVRSVVGAGPLIDTTAVRSADDADLVRCAQTVQQAINILEAARSTLAAETARRRLHARRGEASSAETLVNTTAVGATLARRVEREAQVLDAQPTVAAVLARGEITSEQAAVVAGADVPDGVRDDLCEQAKHQTADQTRRAVRAAQTVWRRESDAQRRARQRAARSASMWLDSCDGMWHLRATLDALAGDAVNRLLVRAVQRNWRSDKDLPESRRRTVQQRTADALVQLLTATVGQTQTAGPAQRDTARPDAARQAAEVPRGNTAGTDTSAADPATCETATGPAAVDIAAGLATGDAAAEPDASAGTAELAAGDAGTMTGVSVSDGGWATPNATQMIVLTTLDNLRSPPNDQTPAADGGDGEPLLALPVPAAPDAKLPDAASGPDRVQRQRLQQRDPDAKLPDTATLNLSLDMLDRQQRDPDAKLPDAASGPANGLLAVPGAAAITETGTVLDASDLRKIACDTRVIPVVMGGASEVLDVGRATRTIPPALRRALIARDQGCVWPGCERAPMHCDGHHLQHWIDDGPTCLANLALLCHTHHICLHRYHLVLRPPTGPAPPGEGWAVTPAPPSKPRTPTEDHMRQNR